MRPRSGLLISSFNPGNFARYLQNDEEVPLVACTTAPFGQVMPTLLDPPNGSRPDLAVIWATPEHISPAFRDCLESRDTSVDRACADVDAFCAALRHFSRHVECVFVPTFVVAHDTPRSALLTMHAPVGSSRTLLEMNLRLAANLRDVSNVHVLDASGWMELAGGGPRDPKLWYLAKVPFTNDVFLAAVRDIKSCLRGLEGRARKLLVVDLDDTLWGGLVGDVGWEKLRLGGHDAVGEAHVDFQRALKALTRRGIILGIVSKNEAEIALEAIDRHPEMVLRREDFAGWRINRGDKPRNIVELVDELNLGLDSVVFIDDSPAERARVREALPEVLVPEWPADSMLFPRALARLRCFDLPIGTAEDASRVQMYTSERRRAKLLDQLGSVNEWLKTLQLRVAAEEVGDRNFDRVLQLLNKTNQMNLATRRLTALQLREWLEGTERKSWCFRVTDRLGDSGITGLLSVERVGDAAEIRDFVLSCRVIGRKVEETMLHVAVAYARALGLREVRAKYEPTARNRPCLEFLQRAAFPGREGEHVFIWYADSDYPLPDAVECSAGAWMV